MNDLARNGEVVRATRETRVEAAVEIDGTGKTRVNTTVPFLDHLLVTLATHSMMDIGVAVSGDLVHHVVEDVAITLGQALRKALGNRDGITRFGWALVPMDEALAWASLDLVRRPYSCIELKIARPMIESLPSEDLAHFLSSLATSLEATLHVIVQYGQNDHHKVEAAFKALALSFRRATAPDPSRSGSSSSKGVL